MSDFIRPKPKARLTREQLIAIAMAAGASDNATEIPGGGGGGGGTTLDVLNVDQSTGVIQADTVTNVAQVGT